MLELFGGLLAAGIAIALAVSIVGLAALGLLIWGGVTVVNRLTGKTRRQKAIGASSSRKDLPRSTSARRAAQEGGQERPAPTYADAARDYEYLDVAEGATAEQIRAAVVDYLKQSEGITLESLEELQREKERQTYKESCAACPEVCAFYAVVIFRTQVVAPYRLASLGDTDCERHHDHACLLRDA